MAVNTKKTGSTSSAVTKMALRPKRMVSILKELASSRKKKASAISRPNKTASCAKEIASNFEHASNPKKTAKKVSFAADGNKPSEAPQISE